jgi:hypothetical protein
MLKTYVRDWRYCPMSLRRVGTVSVPVNKSILKKSDFILRESSLLMLKQLLVLLLECCVVSCETIGNRHYTYI